MIGAIAGDIVGSRFEFNNIHTKDFTLFDENCFFTDDTVMTCAIAEAVMGDGDYAAAMRRLGNAYPNRGYGSKFALWLGRESMGPYGSFGNGSAMRVSPVAYAYDDLESVLAEAEKSAAVTHDHPEGIKGAQATAGAIFLARTGTGKEAIKQFVAERFGYDLERTVDGLREVYVYNETCQATVPEALICFLESTSFEDSIRNAISIGGDSDTLACITGSIAEAFYGGVPSSIATSAYRCLSKQLYALVSRFESAHRQKVKCTLPLCPECQADQAARIQYGLFSDDGAADAIREGIPLGGCVKYEGTSPEWHCGNCEHEWNGAGSNYDVRVKSTV